MDIVNKVADMITDDPNIFNEYMDADAPSQTTQPPAMVKKAEVVSKQGVNNQKLFNAYKQFFHTYANANPTILFYFPGSTNAEINNIYKKFKQDLEGLGITWSTVTNGEVKDLATLRKGYELYKNLPEAIRHNIIVHNGEQDFSFTPSALSAQRAIRQTLMFDIAEAEKLAR